MRILVTGASGLVGGRLVPSLVAKDHEVLKLSRSKPRSPDEVQWDPYAGFNDGELAKLEGLDAVVHLAGDNVASGSWTEEKKRSIKDSRVRGTKTLVAALGSVETPPGIFVSASAIGYYGDRGDEVLTEESEPGTGFFPEVCGEWEAAALEAAKFDARVVLPRIGVVLSKDGGALEKMLTPFRFGLGGTIGGGQQWMSWIAIDDLVRILEFAIDHDRLHGPINATAPNPVTNEQFTEVLGKVLSRPTLIPVPAFGIRFLYGEMGEKLILEGCRVLPVRLNKAGFDFLYDDLESALRHVLAEGPAG